MEDSFKDKINDAIKEGNLDYFGNIKNYKHETPKIAGPNPEPTPAPTPEPKPTPEYYAELLKAEQDQEWQEKGGPFGTFGPFGFNDSKSNPNPNPNPNANASTKVDAQDKPKSVLEAKRVHGGPIKVIGKIVTTSEMYVLHVEVGPDAVNRDARFIQLEDIEKLDENERLDVILYDDMIENVVAGEIVEIEGINMLENKNRYSKKKVVVTHAESIRYVNRKDLVITEENIEAFKKFAKLDCDKDNCQYNLLKRLIAMFAPNVIGHDDVKLGLLRSIVGGDSHGDPKNGFIDTFMVGDPGTAKSTLGREATKIKPNSRHVSAPHATTKSITGIVDKENEGYTLRLGSIPLAKNAICAIDEITAWPPEEQSQLLDALEDREFDIEKYGRHYKVPAPTTIIATANPIGSSWQDKKIISFDQVSMVGKLLDRFKQIYIFRDGMNEEQDIDEFTERLSIINERKPHNYNFLTGYLIHASNIKIRAITPEAKFMLNQFWKKAKVQGTLGVGIRMLKGLFTIAEAHAKLHLRDVVDATIAKQAMESEQLRMFRYGQSVRVTPDPKDVTYNKCLEILERIQAGIAIRELFELARDSDQQISAYIGTNLSMEHNRKIQVIVHMLRNNSHIKQVGINPVVLQWIGGKSEPELQILPDIPDIPDMTKNKSTKENDEKTSQSDVVQKKVMSGVSGVSGSPLECPDCHRMIDPFDKNIHPACCQGKGPN